MTRDIFAGLSDHQLIYCTECERVLVNEIRQTKFVVKTQMPLIEASPRNNSPLDFGRKLVERNYQLLWFKGDLSPSSLDITYKCEEHDNKYCVLLLLFFDAFLT